MQLLVDKLSCRRGQRQIITDLSFALGAAALGQEQPGEHKQQNAPKGQSLKITGPNGAGKTTLLRCLAGLLKPHAGRVELQFSDDLSSGRQTGQPEKGVAEGDAGAAMRFGAHHAHHTHHAAHAHYVKRSMPENLHFISHANGLKNGLSVEQNLIFWARFYGEQVAREQMGHIEMDHIEIDHIEDVMDQFDLLDLASIPAGFLSAGQKRRLALARFLVARRPLWLMDEPFVSLDQANIALICGHIRSHIAAGGLVIVSTHMEVDLTFDQHLTLATGVNGEKMSISDADQAQMGAEEQL